jgi:2-dehydropantoate 2-reductase
MKVCIAGLGAIGGLFAARLAVAGHEVSALARGATLAAVRERGLALTSVDGERSVHRIAAAADANELPVPDLLLISMKGHALAADARALAPLVGPETTVLLAMNGVPWWFLPDTTLASVDPHGHIADTLPLAQTLGAVVR